MMIKRLLGELYIELLTRITTQPLSANDGVEKNSINKYFFLFFLLPEIY